MRMSMARRRGAPSPEHALQIAVAEFLALALRPPAWWTSIDHAAAHSALVGAIRKARGVKAGIPDVLVVHAGRALWVELKAEDGALRPSQRTVAADLRAAGCGWAEARSVDEVEAALRRFGVPLAARGRI